MATSPDEPTLLTLSFFRKQLLFNQFVLRGQTQRRIQVTHDEARTRDRIAEIKRRLDRELERHPELREEDE